MKKRRGGGSWRDRSATEVTKREQKKRIKFDAQWRKGSAPTRRGSLGAVDKGKERKSRQSKGGVGKIRKKRLIHRERMGGGPVSWRAQASESAVKGGQGKSGSKNYLLRHSDNIRKGERNRNVREKSKTRGRKAGCTGRIKRQGMRMSVRSGKVERKITQGQKRKASAGR